MKKKLTYRDQLLELSNIYNVKEVQDYIRRRKNLTAGQIELILRKNKIVIPKDFKTSFSRKTFLNQYQEYPKEYIFSKRIALKL